MRRLAVYPRLVDGLQIPFAVEGGVRKGETPVHEALREALINSLIHAIHGAGSGVHVIRRTDGYLFDNPGRMLVSPELAIAGGASQCRNPSIQHQFVLVGLGERAGSGIPKILQAWRSQHWRQPLLAEDLQRDGTTLTLSTTSLLPADVLEELTERFPSFPALNEEARLAVATARIEGRVTNRRLQQIIEMHGRDLTHLLRSLVEQRVLVPHGDRGGTWYTVAGPDHVSGAKTADLFDLPWDTLQNSDSSAQSFGSSPQSLGNSSQSPGDSPQSPGSSPRSSTATDKQGFAGEDAGQDPGKDIVAKVSSSRWSPHTEVETAILALCRGEPRTGRQIAEHLNRKAKTIQHNYLPKLVEQGRLKLKYPNEPNHPEQAYRTVSPGEIDQ